MQSDVTLVGGAKPAANLPPVPSARKVSEQAATPAVVAGGAVSMVAPTRSTSQTAAVTEAKIALSAEDAPTAVSQAERVLKPYGVTMLPEPPAETGAAQEPAEEEALPETAPE